MEIQWQGFSPDSNLNPLYMCNKIIFILLHRHLLAYQLAVSYFTADLAVRRVLPRTSSRAEPRAQEQQSPVLGREKRARSLKTGEPGAETVPGEQSLEPRQRLNWADRSPAPTYCCENKVWYEPLCTLSLPLSLFSLTEFIMDLPRAGKPSSQSYKLPQPCNPELLKRQLNGQQGMSQKLAGSSQS